MTTKERRVTVVNVRGLHARAAAKICETAAPFDARITISKGGTTVGARSLMALLMLGAGKGSEVTVAAEGPDADEAVRTIGDLIAAGFHEDD
ncbi:HPr family phosphocarrier protein [Parvularcula lutaonensis]|uniref:HPr family phosphocarrier protein n=1 Tax=Parvularcula lutaonensis TaxID=491923 RepID=A0ABV7M9H4_9PROT|nr:HPr family phosphocarrier protein [Parvularcula lutaonensis]GGY46830.1 HPr kinase [Parvularcula lutaonensis]